MIGGYLTDTVTRLRPVVDAFNKKNDDTAVYSCRIEQTNSLIMGQDGEEQKASFIVFVNPDADVKRGDRLVIGSVGSGTSERKWPVLSVFTANGFDASHLEVIV